MSTGKFLYPSWCNVVESIRRACAEITSHFGASAGRADARRRDAGDAVPSSRSGNAADARPPPRPYGLRPAGPYVPGLSLAGKTALWGSGEDENAEFEATRNQGQLMSAIHRNCRHSLLIPFMPETLPGITVTPNMKKTSRAPSRRMAGRISAFIFVLLFPPFLSVGKSEDKLESLLKRLERTSRNFQSFAADVTTTKYTAILERFDPPENGRFFYRRAENGTALIRWEIVNPGVRILTIQNDEALVYKPKIKSAQKYKLGKNKDKAEYLVLGIGQSPTDLKKAFNIGYRGSENVHGTACSILALKPKDPKAAAMFSSITVWIKDSTGVSTRMKLEEPSGDYLLADFTDEQLNKKIDDSKFRQELPANVDMLQIY